jgi:hypothetical protein
LFTLAQAGSASSSETSTAGAALMRKVLVIDLHPVVIRCIGLMPLAALWLQRRYPNTGWLPAGRFG